MHSAHARPVALFALLVLAACGASGSLTRARPDTAFSSANRARLVRAGELALTQEASAYDALARTRPELLRARATRYDAGIGGPTSPAVYLDDVRQGGIEALRTIPARAVLEVRYLSEIEANLRFTGGHPAGAIVVRTK